MEQQPDAINRNSRIAAATRAEAIDALHIRQDLHALIAEELHAAARRLGIDSGVIRGKMIRPLIAVSALPTHDIESAGGRFWNGVLAIQLAHEASLVHDDFLDNATERRHEKTLFGLNGAVHALVQGDLLLTSAYIAATATESLAFARSFATSVQATVLGEIAQQKAAGQAVTEHRYMAIIDGKSGNLFGCAAAAWPLISSEPYVEALFELGKRIGCLYQMLDDLLDLCAHFERGKPPFNDAIHHKWTWPLRYIDLSETGWNGEQIAVKLFTSRTSKRPSALDAINHLEELVITIKRHARPFMNPDIITGLLDSWLGAARQAIKVEIEFHNRH